jgi:hypothetical protein
MGDRAFQFKLAATRACSFPRNPAEVPLSISPLVPATDLAELILAAVRAEPVRHFIRQRGGQAEMRRVIAGLLRKHCSPSN